MTDMAAEDNPDRDGPPVSGLQSDNGSGTEDDSEDSNAIETLIAGRAKRATAGNRMAKLIEGEEDDDVALLFAEAEGEEDVEFEAEGADDSDAQMDSDSDSDDQGPNAAGNDDLEGEKEVQRQAKAERAKKRKAQEALTMLPAIRKKVKIDPSLPQGSGTQEPRPKKKLERTSWLPKQGAPIRASSRKQTMANKEVTHARLKDHETKRKRLLAQMRKAERDRKRTEPKQTTQADRLAEASKVEKKNAKSLNRWEMMEKKRAEEQQAKLEALHNRKLEGPVFTLWSGVAKWVGDKLVTVGSREVKTQPKEYTGEKRGRKKKVVEPAPDADATIKETGASGAEVKDVDMKDPDTQQAAKTTTEEVAGIPARDQSETHPQEAPSKISLETSVSLTQHDEMTLPEQTISASGDDAEKDGALLEKPHPATEQLLPTEIQTTSEAPAVQNLSDQDTQATYGLLNGNQELASVSPEQPSTSNLEARPVPEASAVPPAASSPADLNPEIPANVLVDSSRSDVLTESRLVSELPIDAIEQPALPVPPPQPSGRNLVILSHFDSVLSSHNKSTLDYSLFKARERGTKATKVAKAIPELCGVTSKPAKYRDLSSGLTYANAYAYKKIQEARQGKFRWSNMLGCYVGPEGVVARGVPEGFLAPTPKLTNPSNSSTASTS